ncbi:uncharacterized protein LOC117107045 [Anneissia japonica]|uniref:uncharacterized protein LOC117107045 n=1 Tax=Anneissia japonica TaxID=1529436 RepID=UPI0014255C14|nr:uncharacterized protein LOC117107045 [Anneissia japonica]
MASCKEDAETNFGGLKLDVSKWFDRRCSLSMLKVLYRDHVKDTYALHKCSKMMDIIELLIGAGHLTPNNLTLLYETIKVTQQFGMEQLIKDRHPSFLIPKDIKNIVITEFTLHRQRLVNLGMALSPDEIKQIGGLYSVAEEHAAESWTLIMDLEQRMVICEGEMEAFIENLKKYNLTRAGKALTEDKTILVNKPKSTATSSDSVKMSPSDWTKCVCGNERRVKYYCQNCKHYLCSTCHECHKIFPMSANHKLYLAEDVRSMKPLQIASLQRDPENVTKLKAEEVHKLDVSAHGKPVEQSPMKIKVEKDVRSTKPLQIASLQQGDPEIVKKLRAKEVHKLGVSAHGKPVEQSPMKIKMEKDVRSTKPLQIASLQQGDPEIVTNVMAAVYKLNASAQGKPMKQAPMKIKEEKDVQSTKPLQFASLQLCGPDLTQVDAAGVDTSAPGKPINRHQWKTK